jgi:hypothetical protein
MPAIFVLILGDLGTAQADLMPVEFCASLMIYAEQWRQFALWTPALRLIPKELRWKIGISWKGVDYEQL